MQRGARRAGFTLLELLIVVTIVGVLAGTVVFRYMGGDREYKLRTEAERLALVLELARESAVARNEEWGLYIDGREYTFAVFDPERSTWQEQKTRPFTARTLETASLAVRVEQRELKLATAMGKEAPAVVIFSSGEQTPFEIELHPDWETQPWLVHSDGLSRTVAERPGAVAERRRSPPARAG
jgi:type II secretion system protein H